MDIKVKIMKYPLLVALYFFVLPTLAEDSFSIYLVRHAEKQAVQDDPKLTPCGQLRAEQIATMLEHTQIKHVYSTAYQRTMATAAPFAKQQQLAIQEYRNLYQIQVSDQGKTLTLFTQPLICQ